MQEMKEKELKSAGNGDAHSHVCKICFESPNAAILLPCRHFCCKSFSKSIPLYAFAVRSYQTKYLEMLILCFLQYVNHVRLLVLSVQFVARRLRIGFLHSPLDAAVSTLLMKVM